jgi:hypothetical protein
MCSPDRSSSWNKDAEVANYQPVAVSKINFDLIRPHLPRVKAISLLGGETFLGSSLEEALDIILAEVNPAGLELVLSTNMTFFPSEKLRENLGRFKEVDIGCSIDAVGERNDYIRFPSKWRAVEENFFRYKRWA